MAVITLQPISASQLGFSRLRTQSKKLSTCFWSPSLPTPSRTISSLAHLARNEICHVLLVALVADTVQNDFVLGPLGPELPAERRFGYYTGRTYASPLRTFPFIAEVHGGLRPANHHSGTDLVHLGGLDGKRVLVGVVGRSQEGVRNQ